MAIYADASRAKFFMRAKQTLTEFITEHGAKLPVSFHVPGHKGRTEQYEKCGFGGFFSDILTRDITELTGADDLHAPESDGLLADLMERYAELYGAERTELLVNGSTAGNMAAIFGTVPRGGKLIACGNCHRSVYNAARLGGIEIVQVKAEKNREFGVDGGISMSQLYKALDEHADATVVLVTNPSYTGFLSDIREIAAIVHHRGKPLIVDQAHGAHLKFFDRNGAHKYAAENLNADIVVNSTHKTLFTLT